MVSHSYSQPTKGNSLGQVWVWLSELSCVLPDAIHLGSHGGSREVDPGRWAAWTSLIDRIQVHVESLSKRKSGGRLQREGHIHWPGAPWAIPRWTAKMRRDEQPRGWWNPRTSATWYPSPPGRNTVGMVRVDQVDEWISLGTLGSVPTVEKPMIVALERSKADITPFMAAYT